MGDYIFVKKTNPLISTFPEIKLKKTKLVLLLTGGCGFVGHHCLEGVLKETDWNVVILDNLNYAGNLNRITDISIWEKEKERVRFVWHDLKSPISETTSKQIGKIDFIWHLAAESSVEKSLEDAIPFVLSNVVGTTNLLEWIKKENPNAKTIVFSTDEIFGPAPEGVYFKEDDRFKPSNPYAASKAGAELMAYAFAKSFKLPILIARSMNIYGERQHPEKFIPKTVRAILKGEKVILHGTPEIGFSSRHWIHAREVCNALLFLTEKGEFKGESYNIVGEEKNVLEIANKISQIIQKRDLKESEMEFVDFHSCRPGHDFRYSMSGEKLKRMGFKYTMSFDENFEKMIEWMCRKENRKWLII